MAEKNKVGMTTYLTPSDCEVVAIRVVNAPLRLVWDAWTRCEHLKNWLLGPDGWTMPVCEMDLRPGGAWHYGFRHRDGSEMAMRGVFREIEPPTRMVRTESWGGDWPETVNTLLLIEEDGMTVMTCTVLYPSKQARDRALQTGMREGWSLSYDRLDRALARTGVSAD
jgi:uncharacterized protein YndB with AHSA1/START domain